MELHELKYSVRWDEPPDSILQTIATAEKLIEQMRDEARWHEVPALVNSNYFIAYHALKEVWDQGLAGDGTFCEWGSGLGVVTCIAAQIGYRATGIEIEPSLCDFARELAKECQVTGEFIQSSYRTLDVPTSFSSSQDFDLPFPVGCGKCYVTYVYPWPSEEIYCQDLFTLSPSKLLITYHGGESLRMIRKRM